MGGPLMLVPAGALTIPTTATLTGLAAAGIATGVGLTWLLSSETATPGHIMKYKEFMKARMKELVDEGLSPSEAMKAVGKEWQARKDDAPAPPATKAQPVKESKLKGISNAFHHLRLEVPYLVEAQPDLSAAWDVAEGVLDFLMENAAGISASEAFRRRAAAAYVRAKGGSSQGDQHEYELGRNLGEALLLVMAHRGVNQNQWIEMLPPQLVDTAELAQEEQGLIDKGLNMLGLNDEESTASKTVKKVIDQAAQAGGQTVLDMLQ